MNDDMMPQNEQPSPIAGPVEAATADDTAVFGVQPAPGPLAQGSAPLQQVASQDTTAPAAAPDTRPRIRWGAVIWGAVFAAIATIVLVVVTDVGRRDDLAAWLADLTPGGIALAFTIVIGGLLLVAGLAGVARRASRRA